MAIFKENNSWTCKVYFTDWTGKKRQKKKTGFRTKKEAQAFETNFLNSCKGDVDILFSNFIEHYLADCKIRLKPTTYEIKVSLINDKILPYFGSLPLGDIDVTTVRNWQNTIMKSEKHYSETYLKTMHNQISAILNYAVKYYGLPYNAAARCGSMGKKNADKMNFWTVDEFKKFIAVVDDPKAYVIFNIFFFSGIREGELLALTLNDFDFMTNEISITKTYARVNYVDIIQKPKTPKSTRRVSVPNTIMQMVKEYAGKLYGYTPSERLFPVTKYYLAHRMKNYSELSGVKRIRIHDLRHSYASMLINLNISPLEIQERLGHEDIQTTLNTYSHLYPNKHLETTQKIQNLFF